MGDNEGAFMRETETECRMYRDGFENSRKCCGYKYRYTKTGIPAIKNKETITVVRSKGNVRVSIAQPNDRAGEAKSPSRALGAQKSRILCENAMIRIARTAGHRVTEYATGMEHSLIR